MPAKPKKLGTPAERRKVAEHLRETRAMWPTLQGDWTRREWNLSCQQTAANLLQRLVSFRRANG